MNREELRALLNQWAGRHGRAARSGHPLRARDEELLEAVVERAGVRPGRRVLDLGCGAGHLTLRCLERGATVTGCDRSPATLRQAAAMLDEPRGPRLVAADRPLLAAPFAAGAFDSVVSAWALHQVARDDQPAAIAELLRLARPGGTVAIGDRAFRDARAEAAALAALDWLEAAPYPRVDELRGWLAAHGAELHAEPFPPVTWVFWTVRP